MMLQICNGPRWKTGVWQHETRLTILTWLAEASKCLIGYVQFFSPQKFFLILLGFFRCERVTLWPNYSLGPWNLRQRWQPPWGLAWANHGSNFLDLWTTQEPEKYWLQRRASGLKQSALDYELDMLVVCCTSPSLPPFLPPSGREKGREKGPIFCLSHATS